MYPSMCCNIFNISTLAAFVAFLLPVHAANNFLFPTSLPGQSFHNGDTLEVAWNANFTAPYLQLFCSFVESRKFPSTVCHSPPFPLSSTAYNFSKLTSYCRVAFLNTTILDGSKTFPLKLEIGPQPNRYLLLSQGAASFATGIFAITPSNRTSYVWGQNGVGPASTGIATNGTAANQTSPDSPAYNGTLSYSRRFIEAPKKR